MDCLERGYVFRSKLGLEEHFAVWHDVISTELLFASYTEFVQARRERHPISRESLGRFLAGAGAKPKRLSGRKGVVGEHMRRSPTSMVGQDRKPALLLHPRPPGYHLGGLGAAREAFSEATGLNVAWPDAAVQ